MSTDRHLGATRLAVFAGAVTLPWLALAAAAVAILGGGLALAAIAAALAMLAGCWIWAVERLLSAGPAPGDREADTRTRARTRGVPMRRSRLAAD